MIRVVGQGARWGALLVALGLMMAPVADVRAADPADQDTKAEAPREVAQVKIEIKLESGRVVKPEAAFTIDYGIDSSLEVQAEGASHQFMLNIKPKGDGKKVVSLTVGYDRDGEAIIAPVTFDAKVKKREVLRIEGGMALAFIITPKKVDGEAQPPSEDEQPVEPEKKPKDKIDVCEENDPLCGMD